MKPLPDPELELQRDELRGEPFWMITLMFCLFAASLTWEWFRLAPARAWRWLNWRRECAWCKRRIGGNPVAYATTHGICPECRAGQIKWIEVLNPPNPATDHGQLTTDHPLL